MGIGLGYPNPWPKEVRELLFITYPDMMGISRARKGPLIRPGGSMDWFIVRTPSWCKQGYPILTQKMDFSGNADFSARDKGGSFKINKSLVWSFRRKIIFLFLFLTRACFFPRNTIPYFTPLAMALARAKKTIGRFFRSTSGGWFDRVDTPISDVNIY